MEPYEIDEMETDKLYACMMELSNYHNEISINFKGLYPKHPYSETLELFRRQLCSGYARIAVIGKERIEGFCKISVEGTTGKLDYLVVTKSQRGKGYGRLLMDWAMKSFQENKVQAVEVKAVDGNPAIHLYEKYGFQMEAHILRKNASLPDSAAAAAR